MTELESSENTQATICPTCGTRLSSDAARCVVCGTSLSGTDRRVARRRFQQITLDLPVALAAVAVFALISAGITYGATQFLGQVAGDATPTSTITLTPTLTWTPSPTATETPAISATPLPPIEYTVVEGDTCGGIAFFFDVSVRSIINLNNLGTQCILSIGQRILIPQPTPTVTPVPTATLAPAEATEAACEKIEYTVQANDTLIGIAQNYNVSMQGIKDYNGLTTDNVFEGQLLLIPLCERLGGPTPTSTVPPPYPAPNLLLPKDGEPFNLTNDTVTLQWASVGSLRDDEFYRVAVEDITEASIGEGRETLIDYVTDTKYIIPVDFRPVGPTPHVLRWWVETVRLSGSTPGGDPRYVSAGAASLKRVFTWSGAASEPTPLP
jgi:LysM repeat protein